MTGCTGTFGGSRVIISALETIVQFDTELNAKIYELLDLTPAEIKIIEESTKYKYGEV